MNPNKYLSKSEVQDLVAETLGLKGIERVFLLTHWQYFGIQFNPVSYYYCFSKQGHLIAMISEVHNTPWGEMIRYVHPCNAGEGKRDDSTQGQDQAGVFRHKCLKNMHVSPFFGMNYEYSVQFTVPGPRLSVRWQMHRLQDNTTDFTASMTLKAMPITQANLLWVLVAYPFMTAKVLAGIYWQAFLLWYKVPFYSHPKYSKQEQEQQESVKMMD